MKKPFNLSVLALLALLFTLTGCTPFKELKELSIVEGVGVDLTAGGEYSITFQVFKPSSGGGDGKGGSIDQTDIIRATGRSIFEASRNATLQMGKRLYYGNSRALILGKSLCQKGISDVFDFLERNHEIPPEESVFMAEGQASDVLTVKKGDSYISAQEIQLITKNNLYTSKVAEMPLSNLQKIVSFGVSDYYLPILAAQNGASSASSKSSSSSASSGSSSGSSGEGVVMASGSAVFNQNRLVGTMSGEVTRGFLFLDRKVSSGILVVFPQEGGKVSLEIVQSGVKTQVGEKNGLPAITETVTFQTNIAEVDSQNIAAVNDKVKNELIGLQNAEVKREAQAAITESLKKANADIFGFGELIYETEPDLWQKIGKTWNTQANKTQITIYVNSQIVHNGLITK